MSVRSYDPWWYFDKDEKGGERYSEEITGIERRKEERERER